MKSSTTGRRNGLLLLLLLGIVLARDPGAAMVIHLDGHASVRILLASEDTVLFATRTSGSELERLIALEAGTGAVRWRALAGRVGGAALLPPDAFYLVSKDHLDFWPNDGDRDRAP